MITDLDITKLKKVFATKEDLIDVKLEVGTLNEKMDSMEGTLGHIAKNYDAMAVSLDRIAGNYDTMVVENGVGAMTLARHKRQIEALAENTGTVLPD